MEYKTRFRSFINRVHDPVQSYYEHYSMTNESVNDWTQNALTFVRISFHPSSNVMIEDLFPLLIFMNRLINWLVRDLN
jgi:hypothetical protein